MALLKTSFIVLIFGAFVSPAHSVHKKHKNPYASLQQESVQWGNSNAKQPPLKGSLKFYEEELKNITFKNKANILIFNKI